MINLAMITYALPAFAGVPDESRDMRLGLWAFWLMIGGMFGMTMALAAAGITQTYLERIMGFGYLETQQKIQVHYLVACDVDRLCRRRAGLYLGLCGSWPAGSAGQTGLGPAKAGGIVTMYDSHGMQQAIQLDSAGLLDWPSREPFYLPIGREVDLFEAASRHRLPVSLKGPTGCGKTRFVRAMAWRLHRPLVTVACHDDLSAMT